MDAIATRREDQTTSLVDEGQNRPVWRRIKHNICQGHCMPRRMTDEVDAHGMSYETARAIGADGVTGCKAEWRFAVTAPYRDAISALLQLFHGVAAPDVDALIQCALFDEPFSSSPVAGTG